MKIVIFGHLVALENMQQIVHQMAELLKQSQLDWTIVRFMTPTDKPLIVKPKVSFGDVKIKMELSRENIAAFMIDQIANTEYRKSMPISGS